MYCGILLLGPDSISLQLVDSGSLADVSVPSVASSSILDYGFGASKLWRRRVRYISHTGRVIYRQQEILHMGAFFDLRWSDPEEIADA